MTFVKKQAAAVAAARAMSAVPVGNSSIADQLRRPDVDQSVKEGTGEGAVESIKRESSGGDAQLPPAGSQVGTDTAHATEVQRLGAPPASQSTTDVVPPYPTRQPWEYVEEIVQILKTASPLLILSMETMIDQINQRFKATPEEEIYRLICMLLQDAIQVSPS
jgi:transformation/transcription domain-associated protein